MARPYRDDYVDMVWHDYAIPYFDIRKVMSHIFKGRLHYFAYL